MALCLGLPGWASTKKEKPIWILLKQETVSGSGFSWAICKSAPRSRQIPHQHLTAQFCTGRMPFLPPNQQRQSTEYVKRSKIWESSLSQINGKMWNTPCPKNVTDVGRYSFDVTLTDFISLLSCGPRGHTAKTEYIWLHYRIYGVT